MATTLLAMLNESHLSLKLHMLSNLNNLEDALGEEAEASPFLVKKMLRDQGTLLRHLRIGVAVATVTDLQFHFFDPPGVLSFDWNFINTLVILTSTILGFLLQLSMVLVLGQGPDFGTGRSFGRGTGGRMGGGCGFGMAGMERKKSPQGYVCLTDARCLHCPTNGDPNYDMRKVKQPTGIPRSMLMVNPQDSYALPNGYVAVFNSSVVFVVFRICIFCCSTKGLRVTIPDPHGRKSRPNMLSRTKTFQTLVAVDGNEGTPLSHSLTKFNAPVRSSTSTPRCLHSGTPSF
ncbi:hypothetical protein VNO80_21074 [Phaseolus coccineus]|uniref:Uncharacterized protein n=1 Tax=Phaseolus coccineus TaxID=3886 RepID=A0AAN9M7B5_PHACN